LWESVEKAARAKAEEESSLYRYRTTEHKIDLDDTGEGDSGVVRELFPVYDDEFENSDEREDMNESGSAEEVSTCDTEGLSQFSSAEMEEISDLHQLLFDAHQLRALHQSSDARRTNYSLAASLADIISQIPGLSTDYCLVGGHARMCKDVLKDLTQETQTKQQNVYKESVVSEARKAGPVVAGLKKRVEELLVEWPDHPGLVQVMKSCERVLSLGVQEPLMKVLAGLEYILRKAQDWEAYAASHVSLGSQLEELTMLVLDWRRMEFKSWHSLLSDCSCDTQREGAKWWFHMYSLCQESITIGHANITDFLESVHKFIEVAPVGGFEQRLKMLQAFSAEMLLHSHSSLGNILRNSVCYYQQFIPSVISHSMKLKSTVEEEFKNHVRIMRWNDGNYWALKASTEKSHKTLVKFMKKWKAVLAEPVRPLLTVEALQGTENGDSSETRLQQLQSIAKHLSFGEDDLNFSVEHKHMLEYTLLEESAGHGPVQLTAAVVLHRMRDMVHKFSSSLLYCQWNTAVDEFVGEIIHTAKQLQSVEYLEKLEGDKRRSAIKLNNNQKRKAIVELFNYLKKQGLSYRNEVDFSTDANCKFFQLPVINNNLALPELDREIHKYYYRCIGRLAGLQTAFVSPTKDLPAVQLKRCKGYTGHLLHLVCSERITLSSASSSVLSLLHILHEVQSLVDGDICTLQTTEYSTWQGKLLAMVEVCLELVSDFEKLVATLPDETDTAAYSDAPPILACGDNSIANAALSMLQGCVPDLKAHYGRHISVEKRYRRHELLLVTRDDVSQLAETCSLIELFSDRITATLNLALGSRDKRAAMFEFLEVAQSHIITTCCQCRAWIDATSNTVAAEQDNVGGNNEQTSAANTVVTETDCVSLLRKLTLSVQRVMVRHEKFAADSERNSSEG
jgi:midasin